MICGIINGNSKKARTSSLYLDDTRHKPIAHSVPNVVASKEAETAMTPL